jgi:ribosomal protein S18 acetylase RimI-like enzyme
VLIYRYRNAHDEDFAIISTFPQNSEELFYMFPKGRYPLAPDQLAETARVRKLPTVIENRDEIAGYANLYEVTEDECCWLGNVIVKPAFRGQGAAGFMLQTMMKRAKEELNVREMRLICHNTNTKALIFYYKYGFGPFDLKRMQDSRGQEIVGIMMKKELDFG